MKTSSVEFIFRSPNPSPMNSKYHLGLCCSGKFFEPWRWKRRKKREIVFEQTSRTLQRKISMRSTKDQLVEKDVLMPWKYRCGGQRTVGRIAVMACSQKQGTDLRAQAQLKRTETRNWLEEKQENSWTLEEKGENVVEPTLYCELFPENRRTFHDFFVK
ncbi:hypothetical protein TNCV_3543341 [Trichonephila clavipes]|nr:hypothetical protein TNCV_3543341 [Trichonephila clavipes]